MMENQANKVTLVDADESDIENLLEGSKSKNTNRSTNTSLTRFCEYLRHAQMPDLEELDTDELPKILTNFYMSVRTKKNQENYIRHPVSKCLELG